MALIEHAKKEMELAGLYREDSVYGGMIPESVLELMEVFAKQGHSGGSAPIVADIFYKLAMYKNLSPVTGEDDEWMETGDNVFQNKRCSALFKQGKDGRAYYLDAVIWKTQNGGTFSGQADLMTEKYYSRNYVKAFPFIPKTFVIDVTETEVAKDDWKFEINYWSQLVPAFEYYDRYETHDTK